MQEFADTAQERAELAAKGGHLQDPLSELKGAAVSATLIWESSAAPCLWEKYDLGMALQLYFPSFIHFYKRCLN